MLASGPRAEVMTSSESASPFITLRAFGYTESSSLSRNGASPESSLGMSFLYLEDRFSMWVLMGTSLRDSSFSISD